MVLLFDARDDDHCYFAALVLPERRLVGLEPAAAAAAQTVDHAVDSEPGGDFVELVVDGPARHEQLTCDLGVGRAAGSYRAGSCWTWYSPARYSGPPIGSNWSSWTSAEPEG